MNIINSAVRLVLSMSSKDSETIIKERINNWFNHLGREATPYELASLEIIYKDCYFNPTFQTIEKSVEAVFPQILY